MKLKNEKSKKGGNRTRFFHRESAHGNESLRNELETIRKQQQEYIDLLESQQQAIAKLEAKLGVTPTRWKRGGGRSPSTQTMTVLFALSIMMMLSMSVNLNGFTGRLANDNNLNTGQATDTASTTLLDNSDTTSESFTASEPSATASTVLDKSNTTSESSAKTSTVVDKSVAKAFMKNIFPKYKAAINKQMEEDYPPADPSTMALPNCSTPLVPCEFGMELRAIVPWAYKRREECSQGVIHTNGVTGSRYMYFFSNDHFIHTEASRSGNFLNSDLRELAEDNPFGRTVHRPTAPKEHWKPPPFAEFFGRPAFFESVLRGKPLVVILNKYTKEWGKKPFNFFDEVTLKQMLTYLTPKYTVLYKRSTPKALGDDQDKIALVMDLDEKELIRTQFPDVLMMEDFSDELTDPEDYNLLQFGFMSKSSRFLTVQGGTAVVGSYFGGTNIILIQRGKELETHDYEYFHEFSNATVIERHTPAGILDKMRLHM